MLEWLGIDSMLLGCGVWLGEQAWVCVPQGGVTWYLARFRVPCGAAPWSEPELACWVVDGFQCSKFGPPHITVWPTCWWGCWPQCTCPDAPGTAGSVHGQAAGHGHGGVGEAGR